MRISILFLFPVSAFLPLLVLLVLHKCRDGDFLEEYRYKDRLCKAVR